MKNYVQDDDVISVTAPYAVASGGGCLVGVLFGIAQTAAASGATVQLQTEGVFDITALSTDTASGTTLVHAYWDDTNKRVTTTATSNTLIGVIVGVKNSGDATARVRLNGSF